MRKLIKYFTRETSETNKLTNFERWQKNLYLGVGEVIVVFIPFTILGAILINYLRR